MSRLKKFKNRKKLMLVSKLLAIFYVTTFIFSYLSSGTGAYFINSNSEKQVIEAGSWWDGSDLVFTGKPTQTIKACPPVEISVGIKNKGFGMIGSTEYEVYYSENGNPKNQGTKIAEGSIDPIDAGATDTLTYKAEKIGSYMFKAKQRSDYEGDGKKIIWSEKVMVKCIEKLEEEPAEADKHENAEEKQSEQGNEEEKSDSKTDSSKEEGNDSADESEAANNDDTKQEDKKDQGAGNGENSDSSNESDKSTENTGAEEDKKQENTANKKVKKESETNAEEGDSANEQTK
ncbi:amyloid fiber anchoring/assembly protein TapA [Virgibacillus oceani]|nr:amyloid fiber anchoring/assembly protein TapA [Virgibacillus oceani]